MGELVYKLLDKEVIGFTCGNGSIENMIKNAYFQTLLQHGYAYKFCGKGRTLGYYMVNFEKILLEDCEEAVGGYYDENMKNFYAVNIRFIAVDSKYQGHNIGKSMLDIIVKQIREMSENWPIRMITLDAVKEKYNWYINNGFLPFNYDDINDRKPTIKMYIDCQTSYNKERLKEYIM